jgi:hypothetical protein
MDSTYFIYDKHDERNEFRKDTAGYIAIKNKDIMGSWSCLITWKADTALIIEPYYDFKVGNHPQKLKLIHMENDKFRKIFDENNKGYIKVDYK